MLEVHHLRKRFGALAGVDDVSFAHDREPPADGKDRGDGGDEDDDLMQRTQRTRRTQRA